MDEYKGMGGGIGGMFWRFLVAADPGVDRFIGTPLVICHLSFVAWGMGHRACPVHAHVQVQVPCPMSIPHVHVRDH
eukprot:4275515-Prymnesium_polylepis.1